MADPAVSIGSHAVPVWPRDQRIKARGDAVRILTTTFTDTAAYHPGLIAHVLAMKADPRFAGQYGRSLGGTKLYHLDQWDSPEARLLNDRAMAFFKVAAGVEEAAVDIAWVNVYGTGDYVVPHSHVRSTASLVYCLDPGDPDPRDPNSGLLSFVDPRFPDCCQLEPQRMTNPLKPKLVPGTMVLFPSELVHCVNPYGGSRPRITVSWNINRHALPGSPLDTFGIKQES